MTDFDLDLRSVEEHLDRDDDDASGSRIVLGVLDGTTDPNEWAETIRDGNVLVLSVEGDLNELAAGFARDVRAEGGDIVHFRGFLIVTPEDVVIDNDRLH